MNRSEGDLTPRHHHFHRNCVIDQTGIEETMHLLRCRISNRGSIAGITEIPKICRLD